MIKGPAHPPKGSWWIERSLLSGGGSRSESHYILSEEEIFYMKRSYYVKEQQQRKGLFTPRALDRVFIFKNKPTTDQERILWTDFSTLLNSIVNSIVELFLVRGNGRDDYYVYMDREGEGMSMMMGSSRIYRRRRRRHHYNCN